MRKCERAAVRDLALPVALLMEHAGFAVAEAAERRYGPLRKRSVVIVCGKGNNGGDGFVAARALLAAGAHVTAVLCADLAALNPLARTQAERFIRLLDAEGDRSTGALFLASSARHFAMLRMPDLVIDALFGTGFSGTAAGVAAQAIEWMNGAGAPTISIDVPSGLDADSGSSAGSTVRADVTVTFQATKLGLLIGEGRSYAGVIEVADIGISESILALHASSLRLEEGESVRRALPVRPRSAHKHSVGKVLMIAGAVGFAGAAAMASESALRAGAGSVILVVPKSLYRVLSRKLTEVMVLPAEETPAGTLSAASWPEIDRLLAWADVVGVGPGLTQNSETVGIVHSILGRTPARLLLDADGINAFSGSRELLRKRKGGELVLTPHLGEFSRITGSTVKAIDRDRIGLAGAFAKRNRATLVLKGAPTLTALPSGKVTINDTGNPGMATAGSGDILTGILAGLWAQGMTPGEAASCAVYLHGLAGDLARDRLGERSLLALDILDELPRAFLAVEGGGTPHAG